jgi:hypothetical protein
VYDNVELAGLDGPTIVGRRLEQPDTVYKLAEKPKVPGVVARMSGLAIAEWTVVR